MDESEIVSEERKTAHSQVSVGPLKVSSCSFLKNKISSLSLFYFFREGGKNRLPFPGMGSTHYIFLFLKWTS